MTGRRSPRSSSTTTGATLLDTALPSLLGPDATRTSLCTVIDNGSSDGSAAYVRERWPSVEVLELPVNVGVAAALNRGYRGGARRAGGAAQQRHRARAGLARAAGGRAGRATRGRVGVGQAAALLRARRDRRGRRRPALVGRRVNRGGGERDEGQYDGRGEVLRRLRRRRAVPADGARGGRPVRRGLLRLPRGRRLGPARAAARVTARATSRRPSATTCAAPPRASRSRATGCRSAATRSGCCSRTIRLARSSATRRRSSLLNAGLVVQDLLDGVIGATLRGWLGRRRGVPRILRKRRAIQRAAGSASSGSTRW